MELELYNYTSNNWSHWNSNEKLKEKFGSSIDSPQKTAILGTSHIIRKVLQCETWSLSDEDHRWFKRSKDVPWQAEVALGVPGRLRPQIISTFGTTRVVGRQPYAPAAFIPGEIPGTHFQRLSRPQGTWFCRKEPRKKSPVTPPGIDPGAFRIVAHYATPGPWFKRSTRNKRPVTRDDNTNNNNNNNNWK